MKVIQLTRERGIYLSDTSAGTAIAELQAAAMLAATAQVMSDTYASMPGITVLWAPQDSLHPIALEGLSLGPCAPPVYFMATDFKSDLTLPQIQQLVQDLVKLPGAVNRVEPQQFDPSVATGQADPVGIISGHPPIRQSK